MPLPAKDKIVAGCRDKMDAKIRERVEGILFDDALPLAGERDIKELKFEGGVVRITLGVDPSNSPLERFDMEDRVREALLGFGEINKVLVSSVPLFASSEEYRPKRDAEPKPAAHAHGAHGRELPPKKRLAGVGGVYMVCSAKGGVGKSTVALNTAIALKQAGHRVGLLDLDLYGPSVCALIGTDMPPLVVEDRILAPEVHGLSVLSIGMMMDKSQPLIWRGPMVSSVINQLLFEVDWSGLDYLVIDMPPGTGDSYLSLMQSIEVDGAIIVTTPSELALADVTRGAGLFEPFDVKVLGVVENMAFYTWPGAEEGLETLRSIVPGDSLMASKLKHLQELLESAKELRIFGNNTERYLKSLGLSLIASLPLDSELQTHNDSGKPYMLEPKRAEIMRAFMAVAQCITEHKP